jgi:hypothetical protein
MSIVQLYPMQRKWRNSTHEQQTHLELACAIIHFRLVWADKMSCIVAAVNALCSTAMIATAIYLIDTVSFLQPLLVVDSPDGHICSPQYHSTQAQC